MKKTSVRKKEQEFITFTSTLLVMNLFFKFPSIDFTLSEVAKNTGLSKSTVSKIIKTMREVGFVTITDLGIVYRIRANRDSWVYKREKILNNHASIVRSNVAEFLDKEFNNPKCIVLFGSFRKGDDDQDSDVDIAVEVNEGVETGSFEYAEFKEIEEQLKRKITVHVFNRKEVDRNLFTSIANGILLGGFLEVNK